MLHPASWLRDGFRQERLITLYAVRFAFEIIFAFQIFTAVGHASNLCVWLQGRIYIVVHVDTVGIELL